MKRWFFPEGLFLLALVFAILNAITYKAKAFEYEFSDEVKATWCKQEEECTILAEVGYFEARGESDEGVYAVMHTVLNRVGSNKWGDSVKDVVEQPWQYSYRHHPVFKMGMLDKKQELRMLSLAYDVYTRSVEDFTGGATHYHTLNIKPFWSRNMAPRGVYGNHTFYEGF